MSSLDTPPSNLGFEEEEYMLFVDENIETIAEDLIAAYRDQKTYSQKIFSDSQPEKITGSIERAVEEALEPEPELSTGSYALDGLLAANGLYLMSFPGEFSQVFGTVSFAAGAFFAAKNAYSDASDFYLSRGPSAEAIETSTDIMIDTSLKGSDGRWRVGYDPF